MAKEIKYGVEARKALEAGVNKLADTIGEKVKRSIYKDTKGFSNTRLTHR